MKPIVPGEVAARHQPHLLQLPSHLRFGIRGGDIKYGKVHLQPPGQAEVLPEVLLVVIGIATDEAGGDNDVVVVKVLDRLFRIIGHLSLAQELQVPLVDALHSQKDPVESRLPHLVHQLLARGYPRGGGLGLVAEVGEPGIDDGLAEPLQPTGVEGDVVVGEEYGARPVGFGIPDLLDHPLQREAPKAPAVHEIDGAELAALGAAPAGLNAINGHIKTVKALGDEARIPVGPADLLHL